MKHVALLRGINVGGNNKLSMAELKACISTLGMQNVTSYINSGNILFETNETNTDILASMIEVAITKQFQLTVPTLVVSQNQIEAISTSIPSEWVNNQVMKCDVLFLWPTADNPEVLRKLPINQEIEDVRYVPGAVLWRIDRPFVTKSKLTKIIGTDIYKQMTIRNCNTVRKLQSLLSN